MLRRLIQFLWLVSVVSHLGEALTCYSCGPHSDQVIPWHFNSLRQKTTTTTLTFLKSGFWVRFKGLEPR